MKLIRKYHVIPYEDGEAVESAKRFLEAILNDPTLDASSKCRFYQDLLYRIRQHQDLPIVTDDMFHVLRENFARQANSSIENTAVKNELVPKIEKVENDPMEVGMNLKRPRLEDESISGFKRFKSEPIDDDMMKIPVQAINKTSRKRQMVDPNNVVYVANKKKHFATLASPVLSPVVEMQEEQREPEKDVTPKRRAWKRYKPVDKVPAKKRKLEKSIYPNIGPIKVSRSSKKFRYEPYKKRKPRIHRKLWKTVDNKFKTEENESDTDFDEKLDTEKKPSQDTKRNIKKEPFIKREIKKEVEPITKSEFSVKKEIKSEVDDDYETEPYFNWQNSLARRGIKRKFEAQENDDFNSPLPKRRRTLRGSGPAPPAGSRIYCRMWKL